MAGEQKSVADDDIVEHRRLDGDTTSYQIGSIHSPLGGLKIEVAEETGYLKFRLQLIGQVSRGPAIPDPTS